MNLFVFVLFVAVYAGRTGLAEQCEPPENPWEAQNGCCGTTAPERYYKSEHSFRNLGQYPWMALVEYEKENENRLLHNCNAFLISHQYVLSAAQCFNRDKAEFGTPVAVLLGKYSTTNKLKDCVYNADAKLNCSTDPIWIPIEKIIQHPNFNNNGNKQNDVALIRLAKKVQFTDFVSPICLPTSDVTANGELPLAAVGWRLFNMQGLFRNSTHKLVKIFDAHNLNFDACKSSFADETALGNSHLCARSEKNSEVSDLGVPLMYTNGTVTEVVGINSYPGPTGSPDVYTKVFAYNAWILENIK